MSSTELRMCFSDRAALQLELDDNLKLGRTFVRDAQGVDVLADCAVVLVHPDDGAELTLSGQAVLVTDAGPMRGIGVQLRPFDTQIVAALEGFVRGERTTPAPAATCPEPAASISAASPADEVPAVSDDDRPQAEAENADVEADDGDADNNGAAASDIQAQPALHERLRKLSLAQQQKVARLGELGERVMLERIYGKGVWESLLHNQKLTIPEVARIARKGTIPRPLLEFIVENNMWIQAPIVRRALLGNPRLSGEAIMKLLRITPKHEVKVIYKTTTYSTQVREAARKVLDL